MEDMAITNLHNDIIVPKEISNAPVTAEQIREAGTEYIFMPVSGDCLEGANICEGDFVAVDLTKYPMPGADNICVCYAEFPGANVRSVMLKEYVGIWGPLQLVGTRYDFVNNFKSGRLNCCFYADEIFGTVCACWDKEGRSKWTCDDELWTKQSIKSGNCTPVV